jgi:hypothetical protein
MAKISRKRRKFQIHLRQKRRKTIKKLQERFKNAKTEAEKNAIIEKFIKIAPHLNPNDYLK